jgi:hypothetical protein
MNGYSRQLVSFNRNADTHNLGVKLGRVCIRLDIPITEVAKFCKVSRMTVYNWFRGATSPQSNKVEFITKIVVKLSARL